MGVSYFLALGHNDTYKLSCGPNTLVGMAEVKLDPY
jgi:hypothetical protein